MVDKKVNIIVQTLFTIVAIYSIGYGILRKIKLDKFGVIVVGNFLKFEEASKGSTRYYYTYIFEDKVYERSFRSLNRINVKSDTLMFFRILPYNPEICNQIDDVKVPYCIDLNKCPQSGWKEIPTCP